MTKKRINYLLKGGENKKRVNLLVKLTKIRSEKKINSLNLYLINGMDEEHLVWMQGVSQSNFNATLRVLNEVAMYVEHIKEYDWPTLKIGDLKPGYETHRKIDLLVKLTSIRSESQLRAMKLYLVEGTPIDAVVEMCGFEKKSNFNRVLRTLIKTNDIVDQIKQLDWKKYLLTPEKK